MSVLNLRAARITPLKPKSCFTYCSVSSLPLLPKLLESVYFLPLVSQSIAISLLPHHVKETTLPSHQYPITSYILQTQ